jgi:thioredoxin reductase (NADPH)
LLLSETASAVTLVHRGISFRARPEFVEKVKDHPKITVLTKTGVEEIIWDDGVEAVAAVALVDFKTLNRNIFPTDAVLIRIGVEPNTDFLRETIDLDENGYIKIDQNCETSVKGIFAVGDVANPTAPTISAAVGMGATAAKTISGRLKAVGSKS